jgi:hypothetical protein
VDAAVAPLPYFSLVRTSPVGGRSREKPMALGVVLGRSEEGDGWGYAVIIGVKTYAFRHAELIPLGHVVDRTVSYGSDDELAALTVSPVTEVPGEPRPLLNTECGCATTDSFLGMPSNRHEVPLHMIRQRPELVVEILREGCGVEVPAHDRLVSASESLNTLHPSELRCDGAYLADREGVKVFGVLVETQLRDDPKKSFSWPAYVATFRRRHEVPVALLVFCPDEAAARRYEAPIELGPPGSVVRPVAVSPNRLRPVTDPHEARRCPELAVLTAPAHADTPAGPQVLRALCEAIAALNRDDGKLYDDYARSLLSDAARKLLEEIVAIENYVWKSDFALEHQAKGRAEGEAKALLLMLRARKVCVSDEARDRIMSCTDLQQLERWVERAVTVDTVDELFA